MSRQRRTRYERLPPYEESIHESAMLEYGDRPPDDRDALPPPPNYGDPLPQPQLQSRPPPASGGTSTLSIVCVVIVGLALLALIFFLVWYFLIRKDTSSTTEDNGEDEEDDDDDKKQSGASASQTDKVEVTTGSDNQIVTDSTADSSADRTTDSTNVQNVSNVMTTTSVDQTTDSDNMIDTPVDPLPTDVVTSEPSILYCKSDEAKQAATSYFNNQSSWKGKYLMLPTDFNNASDTECDIKYQYMAVSGSDVKGMGIDSRRFVYSLDPLEVTDMKSFMSGVTTKNMGSTILDCNTSELLEAAKVYYNTKGEFSGVFTMEPVGGVVVNANANLQCDIKYKEEGDGTKVDYRRITFKRDTNNEWVVDTMDKYLSGEQAKNL
jgi:hypothetical protein